MREKYIKIINERFCKESLMVLATVSENIGHIKFEGYRKIAYE